MAQTKATKKFEKRHLKDTLKRRKEFAKTKQRHQLNAKRKARKEEENGNTNEDVFEGAEGHNQPPRKKQKQEDGQLSKMTVDEFFARDFQVPSKSAKLSAKKKRDASINGQAPMDDEPMSEDSDEPEIDASKDLDFDDAEADNANGLDAIKMHKKDLESLQGKDPEFYKYLKDNDAELLDFDEDGDLEAIDELSGSDREDSDAIADADPSNQVLAKGKNPDTARNATEDLVSKWTAAMKNQNSLRSMREIVLAFRAAAHLNDQNVKKHKYEITDPSVYHEVLVGALRHVPNVLNYHLPVKELANGKIRVPTDSKKYRALTNLIKSYTLSLQHLLLSLSDAATLKLTLTAALGILPYALSFKKVVRDLTKAVVDIWSDPAHSEVTRISAFLVIRRLVVIGDAGIKQDVLRTSYQGLLKGSRTTTVHNIGDINLMKNSSAELWGLADANVAYTTGFTFIRQLAIHLRNSIKNNASDSYKTVYNWQYVHSLDFWSRVLSTQCETLREATQGKASSLRPLIYPLTQVTLGTMRLIPTAVYFPLRFQLIRSLIRLSSATNTFIPLATPLYEVLTSAEMKKSPKPSTQKPIEFETSIRVSKNYLRTRVYQDGVGEQTTELLSEFFYLWCKSIAFPELALPIIVMLKRWLKEVSPYSAAQKTDNINGTSFKHSRRHNKKGKKGASDLSIGGNRNSKVNSMVSLLVQKLAANSRFIEERRAKVDFAPNDRAGVEGFLKELEASKTPLGAFVEGQRKIKEERNRVVEESRREEEQKRKKEREEDEIDRRKSGFGGDSDEEEEDEDEDEEQGLSDEGIMEAEEDFEDESEIEMEEDLELED